MSESETIVLTDESIGADERTENQPSTGLEAFDRLAGGRFGRQGCVEAVFVTDEHFALLAIERQNFGVGENGRVGHLFKRGKKDRNTVADVADLKPAVNRRGE